MHICFITTGNIQSIATSKRALGMANPLISHGWRVSILMEDNEENRHRVALECSPKVQVLYFKKGGALQEIQEKNKLLKRIKPDYIYICAFVNRNIVGFTLKCKKIVEHSELQSAIPDIKGIHKLRVLCNEYFSIIYSDYILNASKYLQSYFIKQCKRIGKSKKPNFYFPYAYPSNILSRQKIDYNKEKYLKYKDKTIFVYLGTITRNYGVFTILDAVKVLQQKYSNFKVLLLGRGRHYDEAHLYIKKKNLEKLVEMPGYIKEEEISIYFSLASCFISPMNDTIQDWARCPSKLYMYLPYKKPIITCQIGEPYEVLQKHGLYYKPGNFSQLANKMENVINQEEMPSPIDETLHSWEYRTNEFINWITSQK